MNCLKYVLANDFISIYYNGDHVIGISMGGILDYGDIFKDELFNNTSAKYLRIEKCHDVETLSRIFDLSVEEVEILKMYYEQRRF